MRRAHHRRWTALSIVSTAGKRFTSERERVEYLFMLYEGCARRWKPR